MEDTIKLQTGRALRQKRPFKTELVRRSVTTVSRLAHWAILSAEAYRLNSVKE
jgi:hypothetical protein